jgi:hypothetical protein
MDRKDLADLLSRARAALENPQDLTELEVDELVEDLAIAERDYRPGSGTIPRQA